MSDFDHDKIKDMEYDPSRGCYVGKGGSEFKVTPYSDGTGYKYDYYPESPYGNAPHSSTHVKSDLNENWERTDNDRSNGGNSQSSSSGSGCYLTSACIEHFKSAFDDNCYELTVLRWFRDNFVNNEDIKHYYRVAPSIVEEINKEEKYNLIYDYIYDNIVDYCVTEIEKGNYMNAYKRYKESILALENHYIRPILNNKLVKTLKRADS